MANNSEKHSQFKKNNSLAGEKSLFSSYPIYLAIFIPLAISSLLAGLIAIENDLGWGLSSNHLEDFWNYHKIPLAILGLIFPSAALVSAQHRSAQSVKQIELTQSQNILSNHFKHVEEFQKAWEASVRIDTSDSLLVFKGPRELHISIFPRSFEGNFQISEEFTEALHAVFNDLKELVGEDPKAANPEALNAKIMKLTSSHNRLFGGGFLIDKDISKSPCSIVSNIIESYSDFLVQICEVASLLPKHNLRTLKSSIREFGDYWSYSLHPYASQEMLLEKLFSRLAKLSSDDPAEISEAQLAFDQIQAGEVTENELLLWYPRELDDDEIYQKLPQRFKEWRSFGRGGDILGLIGHADDPE